MQRLKIIEKNSYTVKNYSHYLFFKLKKYHAEISITKVNSQV